MHRIEKIKCELSHYKLVRLFAPENGIVIYIFGEQNEAGPYFTVGHPYGAPKGTVGTFKHFNGDWYWVIDCEIGNNPAAAIESDTSGA